MIHVSGLELWTHQTVSAYAVWEESADICSLLDFFVVSTLLVKESTGRIYFKGMGGWSVVIDI